MKEVIQRYSRLMLLMLSFSFLKSGVYLFQTGRRFLSVRNKETPAPSSVSVALLIDGENISATLSDRLVIEAMKFGHVGIRRIYGNWMIPQMQGWKDVVLRHGMEVRYQVQTASGKNATDIALTVDAMDLLQDKRVRCFCIASSDTDYTPLIVRLRSAGCLVIGMGRATPTLQKVCTAFIPLEQATPRLPQADSLAETRQASDIPVSLQSERKSIVLVPSEEKQPHKQEVPDQPLATRLLNAYLAATKGNRDEGVMIARLGSSLKQTDATFDVKLYGHKDLTALVQAHTDLFTLHNTGVKGQMKVFLKKQTSEIST